MTESAGIAAEAPTPLLEGVTVRGLHDPRADASSGEPGLHVRPGSPLLDHPPGKDAAGSRKQWLSSWPAVRQVQACWAVNSAWAASTAAGQVRAF
ncbi:hypothetical protein [Amycolatopsis sp. GA6-003]|uniref:hypothetical protein n=1 Tax=Amycolatopsis sp. GA6-003 TaxID=2652444 RepID=UPI00391705AD